MGPSRHKTAWSLAVVFLTATFLLSVVLLGVEPRPRFAYRFERYRVDNQYSNFVLFVAEQAPDVVVSATLVLLKDKQLIGRIPLRKIESKTAKTPTEFLAQCLAKSFLDQYGRESMICLYLHGPANKTEIFNFLLREADDKSQPGDRDEPVPSGSVRTISGKP